MNEWESILVIFLDEKASDFAIWMFAWLTNQQTQPHREMRGRIKTKLYTLPLSRDGWAGAENRNVTDRPTDLRTDQPTRQILESRVRD